jgi:hypothetical protein
MKDTDFTDSQKAVVGLVAYLEDIIAKASFGLFVPDWSSSMVRRMRRNNELISQRQRRD